MSDEVKAARERYRRFRAAPAAFGHVYFTDPTAMTRDMIAMSNENLSEHPADEDEAIDFNDRTWLQIVGFGEPTINGWPIMSDNAGCHPIEFWLDFDGNVSLIQSNENDHVLIGVRVETRGQLRTLCKALGINLKEGGEA